MSIFRRLKNIWKMSEYVPSAEEPNLQVGDVFTTVTKKKTQKMAEIIHRKPKDPVKELVGEEQSPV